MTKEYETESIRYCGQLITIAKIDRNELLTSLRAYRRLLIVLLWDDQKQDFIQIERNEL